MNTQHIHKMHGAQISPHPTAALDLWDEDLAESNTRRLLIQIEEALDGRIRPNTLPKAPTHLIEAMRYSLLAGGKRLRALLVLESAAVCSDDTAEFVLPIACAVEMIHACSLMLDDLPVMDNALLRRGRTANHLVFGTPTTMLAALSLLTLGLETIVGMASDERVGPRRAASAVAEVARAIGAEGMAGGQELDLTGSNRVIKCDELVNIHQMKTAAFFTSSVRLGAILTGASEQELRALTEYGERLGTAFQIQDDILDVTGSVAETGKSEKNDMQNCKVTFATLHGIEDAAKQARLEVDAAIDAVALFGNRARRLRRWAQDVVLRKQ